MKGPIYQIFNEHFAFTCAAVIILTAIVGYLVVRVMQNIGLERIRRTVYQAFVWAENKFKQGENSEKFEYVVNIAKEAIPAPFNLFITEDLLRDVIQLWFDLVKDLLDNGKVDQSFILDGEDDENQ